MTKKPVSTLGMEAVPLILAWREAVSERWGKGTSSLAPLGPKSRPHVWTRWVQTARILFETLGLSRDEGEAHVKECVELCWKSGDERPPPPAFFATEKSWEMRLRDAENREPSPRAPFLRPEVTGVPRAKLTARAGEEAWKRFSKAPVPAPEAIWPEVLAAGRPLRIVLDSGGLSPHFVALSKTVERLSETGEDLGSAATVLANRQKHVEEATSPAMIDVMTKLFGAELLSK